MRIDSHQHFWKFNAVRDSWISDEMQVLRRDFMPDDLKFDLEKFDVNGTIAVQADQSMEETKFLLGLASKNFFVKGVVGWIDLRSALVSNQLEELSSYSLLKGFRHIVQAESDPNFLLQPEFIRGVKKIGSLNYSYDILIRDHQLPVALEFCNRLPDVSLVIDHLAKPPIRHGDWKNWVNMIRPFKNLEHVYCKISGLVTEADWERWHKNDFKIYLDVVVDTFGTKRLMYGSDWPVCLLATDYQHQLELILDYFQNFTRSEQADIFGDTAKRFYRL